MSFWDQTNLWAQDLKETLLILGTPPQLYVALAIIVIGVGLILILRVRRARRPIILSRGQGGDVEIARSTLRGLIVGAALRVPGVEHAACSYEQKGRKLAVHLSIHLAGNAKLKEVEEKLKRGIRLALQQHIGYEPTDVQPINVRVTRIIGDPSPVEETEPILETTEPEEPLSHETAEDDLEHPVDPPPQRS